MPLTTEEKPPNLSHDVKAQSPIAALDNVTGRRGAGLLLDVQRSEGVRYVFGNPGTTE